MNVSKKGSNTARPANIPSFYRGAKVQKNWVLGEGQKMRRRMLKSILILAFGFK